jgi:hypothetical protein
MSKKWVISCRCREIYISLPHITTKSTFMTHAGHRAYKKVDQRNRLLYLFNSKCDCKSSISWVHQIEHPNSEVNLKRNYNVI